MFQKIIFKKKNYYFLFYKLYCPLYMFIGDFLNKIKGQIKYLSSICYKIKGQIKYLGSKSYNILSLSGCDQILNLLVWIKKCTWCRLKNSSPFLYHLEGLEFFSLPELHSLIHTRRFSISSHPLSDRML